MKQERGAIAMNVLLILLMLVIGVLVYLLVSGQNEKNLGRNIGLDYAARDAAAQSRPAEPTASFNDGLPNHADEATTFDTDEFGAGITMVQVFMHDIDGDGRADRITRTRVETGTDHFSDEYTIELRRGDDFIDITPPEFQTVEGAECSLQKIQFVFKPDFRIIKISRPWRDSWSTPTMAEKTVYAIADDGLNIVQTQQMKFICDVSDLF